MGGVRELAGPRAVAWVIVALWSMLRIVPAAVNACAEKAAEKVRIEKDVAYLGPDRQEKGAFTCPLRAPQAPGFQRL